MKICINCQFERSECEYCKKEYNKSERRKLSFIKYLKSKKDKLSIKNTVKLINNSTKSNRYE